MLEVGSHIRCYDAEDMINTMEKLSKDGVKTDFCYKLDGKDGYWLEVTKIGE